MPGGFRRIEFAARCRTGIPGVCTEHTYDALPQPEKEALPDAEELAAAFDWDGADNQR